MGFDVKILIKSTSENNKQFDKYKKAVYDPFKDFRKLINLNIRQLLAKISNGFRLLKVTCLCFNN